MGASSESKDETAALRVSVDRALGTYHTVTIQEELLAVSLGTLALLLDKVLDVRDGLAPSTSAVLHASVDVGLLAIVLPADDDGIVIGKRLVSCSAVTALVECKDVDVVRGQSAEVGIVPLDVLCKAMDKDDIRVGLAGCWEPLQVRKTALIRDSRVY